MLNLGNDNPTKVFFDGADELNIKKIKNDTCVLLISQSGQTFPTLHATNIVSNLVMDRLWIVTGCINSKMEQTIIEHHNKHNLIYKKDRVFNNLSSSRPSEPSTVAVAATWHTLTKLMMFLVNKVKVKFPSRMLIHIWEYDAYATTIQQYFKQLFIENKLKKYKMKKQLK